MLEMNEVTGVFPIESEIKKFVNKHKSVLNEKKKKRRPINEIHNAYTDYILALLMCSVGHRPVEDPFGTYDCFDLESGLVLLSDKVVLESRAWRLASLPKIACDQIEEYINYLECLSQKLSQNKAKQLASLIANIPYGEKFPFLFYLNKKENGGVEVITPQKMKERWCDFWNMPVNFTRHITAQLIINGQCSVEDAQIQLGHISSIYHTFGKTSDKAPIITLSKIGECINMQLVTLGFDVIKSPIRRVSSPAGLVKSKKPLKYVPGYEKRSDSRRHKREVIIKIVKELLNKSDLSLETIADSEVARNKVVSIVINAANKHGASENYCLKVLYKYLFRGIKDKKKIRQLRAIEPESSPFTKKSLTQYRKIKHARNYFSEYLRNHATLGTILTPERRKAEIKISAIIFGGITNKIWLEFIDKSLNKNCYQLDGQIFIDLPIQMNADNYSVFRWHPDPITRHLIIGYYKDITSMRLGAKVTTAKAIEMIFGKAPIIFKSVNDLYAATKDASKIERPGYIASVTSGEIVCASLPLSSHMRAIKNKSLTNQSSTIDVPELDNQATWFPIVENRRQSNSKTEKSSFRMLWSEITKEISQLILSGNEDANKQRRRFLSSMLKEYNLTNSCPDDLSLLLMSWAVSLCEKGTRYKSSLAYGTVVNYVSMIESALRSELTDVDILFTDDDTLMQAYVTAVENAKAGSKEKLAGRIDEFHNFIYNNFGVVDTDLTEVYAAAGLSQGIRIDANIITEYEYHDIIRWMIADDSIVRKERYRAAACIIFGYRLGLRFGEVYKLLFRDIQYDGDNELVVVVDDNLFDGTKSEQSRRVAYLTEDLSEYEKNVVRETLAYSKSNFEKDNLAAFLSQPELPRNRTSKRELALYISYMLKSSTGDASIRFHHLRHSFATKFYSRHIYNSKTTSHSTCYKLNNHFTESQPALLGSRLYYPLVTLRTLLGHSGSETTIGSYVHNVNITLEQYYTEFHNLLCDHAISYAERSPYATVRSMRRRNSKRRYNNIPTPKISLRKRKKPKSYAESSKYHQVTPESIDTILALSFLRHLSHEAIAERVALHVNDVKKIILLGIELERSSGFTRYALMNLDTNYHPVTDIAPNLAPSLYDSETYAIHQYFRNKDIIRRIKSQRDDIALHLNSWERTYNQSRQSNVITSKTELEHIVNLISVLGISSELIVHADDPVSVSNGINHFCSRNKITIFKKSIPAAHDKLTIIKMSRVELFLHVNDKTITTRRAFHRILFLVDLFVKY